MDVSRFCPVLPSKFFTWATPIQAEEERHFGKSTLGRDSLPNGNTNGKDYPSWFTFSNILTEMLVISGWWICWRRLEIYTNIRVTLLPCIVIVLLYILVTVATSVYTKIWSKLLPSKKCHSDRGDVTTILGWTWFKIVWASESKKKGRMGLVSVL